MLKTNMAGLQLISHGLICFIYISNLVIKVVLQVKKVALIVRIGSLVFH